MFKDFGRRLQRDIKKTVDVRLKLSETLGGGRLTVRIRKCMQNGLFFFQIQFCCKTTQKHLFSLFQRLYFVSAETYRCPSCLASYAKIRCMVWWKHAGINCKCFFAKLTFEINVTVSSRNSTPFATPKNSMKSMDLVFADIIPFSVR